MAVVTLQDDAQVKDSKFQSYKMLDQNAGTRSRYFDRNALSKKSIPTVLDCGGVGDIFSKLQSKPGCIVECMYPGMYLKDSLIERPKSTLCVSNLKQTGDQFKRQNINQTICIDPEMLTLAQLLERDVLRGSSKVDFAERRGVGNESHNLH